MKFPNMILVRLGLLGLGMLAEPIMAQASGLTQSYCSTQNTGEDSTPLNSIYMSMGKCFDNCKASYAFAVVQYKNCWCSNYIPAQQESTTSCSQQCPGYPGDLCGNGNDGLFGYIPLYNAPAGTAGASSSSPAPQSSSPPPQPDSSSQPPATSYAPSSSAPPSSSEPDPEPSSSSSSNPPITSSSDAATSTSPTPVRTVIKTTISGSVVTQTVTQTPIVIGGGSSGTTSPDNMQVQQQPLSIGAIAGIVVGTLVGLAALLVAAFLLWRRKKHQDAEAGSSTFTGGAAATKRPRRNTSVLSKTGLLSRNRQSMSENTYDDNLYGPGGGGNSVRHSMLFGAGAAAEGVDPVSPLGSSADNVSAGTGRRHSKPLVYDQRLNPSALFANADANGSRVSIQDQNDYSRPLGVANPDMRASFDSR